MPEPDSRTRDRGSDSHIRHSGRSRRRDNRSRSRSPRRDDRSPYRQRHNKRKHDGGAERVVKLAEPVTLPLGAAFLSKSDMSRYKTLFAMYLDIQKNIDVEDLDERELKGRWKSFVGKWNRGELAEGWYDPATLEKAKENTHSGRPELPEDPRSRTSSAQEDRWRESGTPSRRPERRGDRRSDVASGEETDEDEGYGPQLPSEQLHKRPDEKFGPTIPTMQDLQLRREDEQESHDATRVEERLSHKYARQTHKSEQRHLEDEVAPRAEAGTHERKLEKRQELAASNRTFAESRRGGSPGATVPDTELMGGGDDLDSLKQVKEKETRKKNDREIRKEEMLRARAAEREERLQTFRRKEDDTMEFLRALAKQRYG